MVDIEYIIKDSFRCYGVTIGIGGLGYNKLKDQDQDQFISDALTHEFIHALLENMFDITTSSLYDCIGDKLLNARILKRATCLTINESLWSDAIKEEGIRYIYDAYMIDNIDLIQSYLICNTRL